MSESIWSAARDRCIAVKHPSICVPCAECIAKVARVREAASVANARRAAFEECASIDPEPIDLTDALHAVVGLDVDRAYRQGWMALREKIRERGKESG